MQSTSPSNRRAAACHVSDAHTASGDGAPSAQPRFCHRAGRLATLLIRLQTLRRDAMLPAAPAAVQG